MFTKLLLTAIMAATLAFAQGGGGGGGGGMGDDTGGMGGGMGGGRAGGMGDDTSGVRIQRQSPFDTFAERLKLNKDQKTAAQTVLTDALKQSVPLRQQLMESKLGIAKAVLGGANADDLKKTMDAYASVAAQLTGVETKAFAKVCATLKPNQQSKAGAAFELMAVMFSTPAGGAGGRGGGGRRGRD